MSQYLYKKGSLKSLQETKTNFNLDKDQEVLQHAYEVSAICVLNYNIDGIGSALVEKCIIEIIEYQYQFASCSLQRECECVDSEYVIMSYSKLEELMLSQDWIISDYYPADPRHPIEEIMRDGKHATKED